MGVGTQLTWLTRIGFAARGLLYLVIAFLVIRTGRAEDPTGALQVVGQGGGRILLGVMTAGLLAYGLWRLADAVFDVERHGAERKGLMERLAAGASGIVHLFLAWQAVRLIRGAASGGGGAQEGARAALDLPGGQAMVLAGAAILAGVGVAQLIKAAKGTFLRDLEPGIARQPWARWSGCAGYGARGLVFLITGFFLLRAGLDQQASKAVGMAEALGWLDHPWDIVIAAGLAGFGIFSLIEARYRIIHDVPVAGIVRRGTGR